MTEPTKKQRTDAQNRSLHKYYQAVADDWNEKGIEQKVVFELLQNYATVPWTLETVKEVWRILQMAYLLKVSTTELTTNEVDEIRKLLEREVIIPLKTDLIPFPSVESIINEQRLKE